VRHRTVGVALRLDRLPADVRVVEVTERRLDTIASR
jgi:hypothetical protein